MLRGIIEIVLNIKKGYFVVGSFEDVLSKNSNRLSTVRTHDAADFFDACYDIVVYL